MKRKLAIVLVIIMTALGILGLAGCDNSVQIKISGSSSVSPLMQVLAAKYEETHKNIKIIITTSDSGTGVSDTQSGKNEIGMISRDLKDTEEGLTAIKICDDGVVLIVHKDSELDYVTGVQIYALYAQGTAIGSVTNAISREAGSGTRDAFDSLIKDASGNTLAKLTAFSSAVSTQNSTGAVKTQIQGSGNRLGYISLGSLDDTVKALKFNGVTASAANVQNGTYKLSRSFNIIVKQGAQLSEQAQAFIDFMLSEEGQQIIAQQGYVRLPA